MKKLDKILAIASAVMFMSCVGGSPRAVKYNEKGIPYALELPENPTETQVFEELQIVEDFVNKKHKEFSHDQLENNTFDIYIKVYYGFTTARVFVFEDPKTGASWTSGGVFTSDLHKGYYQGVLDGKMGVSSMKRGYFCTLLKNANIECYGVSIHFLDDGTEGHNFVIYKPIKTSKDWYVLPCGSRITMDDANVTPLNGLTIEYYLNSIREEFKLDYLVTEPPIVTEGQKSAGVHLTRREEFSTANEMIDGLILQYKQMIDSLILQYKQMFNLK